MKESQNVWNLSAAMDFNKDVNNTLFYTSLTLIRTDIKQQKNRILTDLLSFSNVNKYTMETRSKTNVFELFNLLRNSSGKKRSKNCNMLIDHFLS